MLSIGDLAPLDIELKDLDNKTVSLSTLLGSRVILYFYPKDFTPGCTNEACSFRDFYSKIESLGFKVVGISSDSVESHLKFKDKHGLNFELWSDTDHRLAKAFGVWQEKKMFRRIGFGIKRTTFIIDAKGKILKVWPDVSVNGHTEQVFNFLKNIAE